MNDPINRADAIRHLKKRLYETALNSNTEHPYYEEIADNRIDVWMNEVPSAQPEPQWIPVSERLPKMKKPILATYKTEDGLKVDRTMYDRFGFFIGEVTAWMPLPKPYRENT